ncbi:MAG: hypothetical protein KIT80_04885 [Chitinophagaceae bacterium]|nr:hypothetical protein [Chitinophagaceae bacterium]MCW5926228.1 hypothetical protein [Chitinophagaceae bacterium]
MNKDLLDILSESDGIDQQKLLEYLQGNVSEEERHEIEKLLIDSDFDSDALEGLESVKDRTRLPVVMNELNRQLVKKLSKRRKKNKKPINLMIPVVTTIIILLLILMFYLYIRSRGH